MLFLTFMQTETSETSYILKSHHQSITSSQFNNTSCLTIVKLSFDERNEFKICFHILMEKKIQKHSIQYLKYW